MTRKLKEIVDEAYDIFMLCWDNFQNDNRWKDQHLKTTNFPYSAVEKVAEMAQHILVNERISAERNGKSEDKEINILNTAYHNNCASRLSYIIISYIIILLYIIGSCARINYFDSNTLSCYWHTINSEYIT